MTSTSLRSTRPSRARCDTPLLNPLTIILCTSFSFSIRGEAPACLPTSNCQRTALIARWFGTFDTRQAVYCVQKLGIDVAKVNPKGGAIALGHPLGCTGARQIATLLHELNRTGQRFGVISMCIGTGMGAAAVLERI
mmetsp:Transcript_26018/g.69251  ORF Transcript_26018/g.69251 Transcript_26018/m.69251 type:complete len:137 (+) Transcript_26018:1065-1475(+)